VYRLGDQVRVRVVRVDLDDRKLDFELTEKAAGRTDGKAASRDRRGGRRKRRSTRKSNR
jgi:ribonuclease R